MSNSEIKSNFYMDINVHRIRAIGLTVSNCHNSLKFYTQALGFEFVSDVTVAEKNYSHLESSINTKIQIVTLRLGDEMIELREYINIQGKPIPRDSQSNDLWFQHLAIVVSDMERAYAHLSSFNIEHISPSPQTIPPDNEASAGVRAFKFKDPDGHDLELIWFPPDKGQDKWHDKSDRLFLGIDHSAIAISHTPQSLHFYSKLLGMRVDSHSLNHGATQARLDNLPQAEVRITALRPIQGGIGIEMLDYILPGKGRPIPSDWKIWDIPYMDIQFVVRHLEQLVDKLRHNGVTVLSSELFQLGESLFPHQQAYLVKDPDGHRILLIQGED